MKGVCCLLLFLFCFIGAKSQYKVTFILKEKTAIQHDSIYVTGTFSNWDSTPNPAYLLKPRRGNEKSITLTIPAGGHRYKFHRGSWLTVEKQFFGDEVPDRLITIRRDTVCTDSVFSWRDQTIADKQEALKKDLPDSMRVNLLTAIADNYAFWPEWYNADSAFYYTQLALRVVDTEEDEAQETGAQYRPQRIVLQEVTASLLHSMGNYPKALEIRLNNQQLAEGGDDKYMYAVTIRNVINDYFAMKDYQNMLAYGRLLYSHMSSLDKKDARYRIEELWAHFILAQAFYNSRNIDSAFYYSTKVETLASSINGVYASAFGDELRGNIYAEKGDIQKAFTYYRSAYANAVQMGAVMIAANAYSGMAKLFRRSGHTDSALYYAQHAIRYLQSNTLNVRAWGENTDSYIAEISPLVAELYRERGQLDSAYTYLRLSVTLKDSLYNADKIRKFQILGFNESVRKQQLEQDNREARQKYETRIKIYGLIAAVLLFIALAFVQYRNNRQKHNANTLLSSQKQEIEKAYGELKTTQAQLLQSEKMASLGELTAGIAHEIQNPLNFVNNFSEVNEELVDEMKTELTVGNLQSATEIADDIKQNLQKINHHGKRADSIVKGMLQHSRKSTGEKEPTDINELAEEYFKLAYHGLRAKDKSFNATLNTDFDKSIGKINIIPQDIGRTLLNLYNNAFYAVSEKKKIAAGGYEPTVSISTKRINDQLEIKVSDNGNGIPQYIIEKIFQPFFTTKPTGQGTGLGLSLAYDIVKAHGGELKVETREGEGSVFRIVLPIH